ncbi:MAG TPA: hypothetical protein GYA07_10215 [Verrucomicrobia bacterium]|nr:hypothetical protein [Verrucomicrobiota bacterium]HOP99054.1 hypothetical protein [Verrucomicrobiota bacterium]
MGFLFTELPKVFALFLAVFAISGCQSGANSSGKPAMLTEVWTKQGWPPPETPTPAGFKVSPNEAFKAVAESKRLSLKHRWICFRDDKHYYIADTFGKAADAKTAAKHGVKVNGVTGAIE